MSHHTAIQSREDFQNALQTKGKLVLIYAYEGEVDPKAEEYAGKFKDKVAPYKVNVNEQPNAKTALEKMGVDKYPSVMLYKDGQEVKKVVGMDPSGMQEVGKMIESS